MAFDVTLPQDRLESLLRVAGRAVSGRAAQPVLSGLLLTADTADKRLTAAGYDLAIGVRANAPSEVAQGGSVVLPYRMASALIGALPAGALVRLVAPGDGTLQIEAGEGRYSVAVAHEPEDFPALPEVSTEPIALPFGIIRQALNAVVFAASTEESKQVLCGVQFTLDKGDLRVCAADSVRASFYDLPGAIEAGGKASFVVPAAAIKEVLKLGLSDDDLLLISHTDAFCLFDTGDTAIITGLTAGKFPPMLDLVPKDCTTEIVADRQGLMDAIERARIVADGGAGVVAIAYDPQTGDISISAANDAGSAADLLAAKPETHGEAVTLIAMGKFIAEGLRHVGTPQVLIGFNDKRLIRIASPGGTLAQQILATVQVKEA